jgi:hypothetical protein
MILTPVVDGNIFTAKTSKIASREYITQITGIFQNTNQEFNVLKSENVKNIKTIYWCINSIGYITLSWEMKDGTYETICIISGNGRWELGRQSYQVPLESTGNVVLTTMAFDSLDTYTIIFGGEI